MSRNTGKNAIKFTPTTIFHVHTYRCGHASSELDIAYVEKAIELGATQIIFTDHCPFPENPFPWRMDYEMLSDYVSMLKRLKAEFKEKIEVKIGLEAEYFPSYDWYYKKLLESGDFDLLILGQHIYEHEDGSFGYTDIDKEAEVRGFMEATVQGMRSGYFQVVAHPDRPLDRIELWDENADKIAKTIAETALENGVVLEQNITSMERGYQYKPEFWKNISNKIQTVYGLDAHCVEDMATYYKRAKELIKNK